MAKPPKHMSVFGKPVVSVCRGIQNSLTSMFITSWAAFLLSALVSVLLWLTCLLSKELVRLKVAWSYLY